MYHRLSPSELNRLITSKISKSEQEFVLPAVSDQEVISPAMGNVGCQRLNLSEIRERLSDRQPVYIPLAESDVLPGLFKRRRAHWVLLVISEGKIDLYDPKGSDCGYQLISLKEKIKKDEVMKDWDFNVHYTGVQSRLDGTKCGYNVAAIAWHLIEKGNESRISPAEIKSIVSEMKQSSTAEPVESAAENFLAGDSLNGDWTNVFFEAGSSTKTPRAEEQPNPKRQSHFSESCFMRVLTFINPVTTFAYVLGKLIDWIASAIKKSQENRQENSQEDMHQYSLSP